MTSNHADGLPPTPAHAAAARALLASYLDRPRDVAHLAVRNVDKVAAKMAQILADGPEHVHVVSDFDMTMTKFWVNGSRGPSSHGVVERSSVVSPKFKAFARELYNTYYPMEIDPNMPRDVKYQKMDEWWRKAHDGIVAENINRERLAQMVQETAMTWRAGLADLLAATQALDIYFMVFSAGIKDLIKEILRQNALLLPHVHVVSNEMIFDAQGDVTGFREPVIHTFNKSEVVLAATATDGEVDTPEARHYRAIRDRRNVILMGDSLGDVHMADGIDHKVCLRVGFCNHDPDTWLEKYMDAFDVVVTDDAGFDVVLDLVSQLRAAKQQQTSRAAANGASGADARS
ncbi:hypothetical protein GGF32_009040 [Allomyces javanicus]|nr:hypothetical protein GGF32_009040 [Allomyces javanicus]